MRKLIVLSFVTLDGVMQAPGGPGEDISGGFRYGGWSFTYGDEEIRKEMLIQMNHNFDLLLGRKTYDIFASYWPFHNSPDDPIASGINKAKKYVVSETLTKPGWANTEIIKGDVPEKIRQLKAQEGPELQVHGSTNLLQTLWKNDLVDELWLKTYPVVLGSGKKLFDGNFARAFKLLTGRITPGGTVLARYERAGEVQTTV